MWWKIAKAVAGFTATAYMNDVVVKPGRVAQLARAYANKVGKPLLNIGAGTPNSSLRVILFGPTLWGDVNIDIAAPKIPHGPQHVSYGDAHDLSEWPDKFFGAIIASHVLEHLERPDLALKEWHRVAEKVFTIVPTWWAPHTWVHPGHLWFIDPDLKTAKPLHIQRMRNLPLPEKNVVKSREWLGPHELRDGARRVPGNPDGNTLGSPLSKSVPAKVVSTQNDARLSEMERAKPQQYEQLVNGPKGIRSVKR